MTNTMTKRTPAAIRMIVGVSITISLSLKNEVYCASKPYRGKGYSHDEAVRFPFSGTQELARTARPVSRSCWSFFARRITRPLCDGAGSEKPARRQTERRQQSGEGGMVKLSLDYDASEKDQVFFRFSYEDDPQY